MTAEIIIANSNGVALAADSAVTVGGQKIFNSAVKVFSLSKVRPVGIMIYGNASLLTVPWEIIIKSYRSSLKKKGFKTVEQYADDFFKYIIKSKKFHCSDSQKRWVNSNVHGYYTVIRDDFLEELKNQEQEISLQEATKLFEEIVSLHYNNLKGQIFILGMDEQFEKHCRQKYQPLFRTLKKKLFENLEITKSTVSMLYDIAVMLHSRDIFATNGVSGIVITGYGKNDIYPSVITHKVAGILDGRLKFSKEEEKCVSIKSGSDCAIIPFAQEEMVNTFMNGINPDLADIVSNYIRQLFTRIPEVVKDDTFKDTIQNQEEFEKAFQTITPIVLKDFFQNFKSFIYDNQVQPIMSMVNVLPKDELASMAETLVNLTAFKRRVTNSIETVGGPIDVAVISLGDGMVWVKRKQYFPKELNSHFFDNYLKEVEK